MNMIGHNNPPSALAIDEDELRLNNEKVLKRVDSLVAAADRIPSEISDQETCEKITDLVKLITNHARVTDESRSTAKAPYLEGCRKIDGFFKPYLEAMDAAKKRAAEIQRKFLKAEEKKEQDRRRELARQEQEKRDQLAAQALELEEQGKKSQADAVLEKAVQSDHDAAFFTEAAQKRGADVAVSAGEMTGARTSLRYTTIAEIDDLAILDLNMLKPYFKREDIQKAVNTALKFNAANIPGIKISEKSEAVTR